MSVSYFHIKPRDEFERPVKQLYMSDERTPKYFAASCVFTHLLMMFPFLSICKMGFECQCLSPVLFGSNTPLFHAGLPFLAAIDFWMLAFSLSYVIGLRWFSDIVHHRRLSALLFARFVSKWSTTAPSKYSPQISGKAKATKRCTLVVHPFPFLYNETRIYPVFLFGGGSTLMPPRTFFNPPFECLTNLSSERILPRLDTSYNSSYPLIGLQISIM